MSAERHYGLGHWLADSGAVTYPKPRRPLRHAIRNYWLPGVVFAAGLVAWFVFVATGHVGN